MVDNSVSTTNGSSSVEEKARIIANANFRSWEFPPYCELCHKYFSSEVNSQMHFKGVGHLNRLKTWRKHQDLNDETTTNSKHFICVVCWKEMNTQLVLDQHCESPAHIKEGTNRGIIQDLKEQYRQLKQ
jgi:hypothetical protein